MTVQFGGSMGTIAPLLTGLFDLFHGKHPLAEIALVQLSAQQNLIDILQLPQRESLR